MKAQTLICVSSTKTTSNQPNCKQSAHGHWGPSIFHSS